MYSAAALADGHCPSDAEIASAEDEVLALTAEYTPELESALKPFMGCGENPDETCPSNAELNSALAGIKDEISPLIAKIADLKALKEEGCIALDDNAFYEIMANAPPALKYACMELMHTRTNCPYPALESVCLTSGCAP